MSDGFSTDSGSVYAASSDGGEDGSRDAFWFQCIEYPHTIAAHPSLSLALWEGIPSLLGIRGQLWPWLPGIVTFSPTETPQTASLDAAFVELELLQCHAPPRLLNTLASYPFFPGSVPLSYTIDATLRSSSLTTHTVLAYLAQQRFDPSETLRVCIAFAAVNARLCIHLDACGLDVVDLVARIQYWTQTAFAYILPSLSLRILDLVLAYGPPPLYSLALALLSLKCDRLLSASSLSDCIAVLDSQETDSSVFALAQIQTPCSAPLLPWADVCRSLPSIAALPDWSPPPEPQALPRASYEDEEVEAVDVWEENQRLRARIAKLEGREPERGSRKLKAHDSLSLRPSLRAQQTNDLISIFERFSDTV